MNETKSSPAVRWQDGRQRWHTPGCSKQSVV